MRKIILGVCILVIGVMTGASVLHAQDPVAELKKLDEQRMKAISNADINAVGALIADDYVHVHSDGSIMDKAGYLAFLAKSARESYREPNAQLIIHVYGDTATMVGVQMNKRGNGEPTPFTLTLIWHKAGGTWKQVGAAYTPVPKPKS